MEKKKMFTRKRVTGSLTGLLIVALLLGGTFAFVDFDQHKTNFAKGGENVSATLNDSYKPSTDWKAGQKLDKKISVTNTAESGDPIFVRVQFKEYFEMSKLKLVTDGTGKGLLFATYASGAKKGAFMTWTDAQAGGYDYAKHTVTFADGSTKDFALTQNAEQRNGIYGKQMYISSNPKIFGNAVKANYPAQPHETQSDTNLECQYPAHIWDTCGIQAADGDEIHNYISWNLGDEVITMNTWLNTGKPIGDFWVLDTTDGWAYWANGIQPGKHTANIMESIKLDKMPGSNFEYYIHVDMQATTVDQLGELKTKGATTGGKDLIDELRKSTLTLPEIIAETPVGGTFESDGVKWRILKKDGGDMLIITEYVYGYGTPYNAKTAPAGIKANTYSLYEDSNLYNWVNNWYTDENCASLRKYAMMPSHFNVEHSGLYWPYINFDANIPAALTSMGARATGTAGVAFTLSASEANQYGTNGTGTLNQRTFDAIETSKARSWWLRSAGPGTACLYAAVVTENNPSTVNYTNVESGTRGARPALWISIPV